MVRTFVSNNNYGNKIYYDSDIIMCIYIADLYEFVRMNPLGAIPQVMNQAYETKNSNCHDNSTLYNPSSWFNVVK